MRKKLDQSSHFEIYFESISSVFPIGKVSFFDRDNGKFISYDLPRIICKVIKIFGINFKKRLNPFRKSDFLQFSYSQFIFESKHNNKISSY